MYPVVPLSGNASLYEYLTNASGNITRIQLSQSNNLPPSQTRAQTRTEARRQLDETYRLEIEALLSEDIEDSGDDQALQPLISRGAMPTSSSMTFLDLRQTLSASSPSPRQVFDSPPSLRPVRSVNEEACHYDEPCAEHDSKDAYLYTPQGKHPHSSSIDSLSLLRQGAIFEGRQCMSSIHRDRTLLSGLSANEEWQVTLELQQVNWLSRTIHGLMRASNVPNSCTPTITTVFEGEILTDLSGRRWHASQRTDLIYWTRIHPFRSMKADSLDRALGGDLSEALQKYVFLKIKEVSFADQVSKDAGLTIAGFYYVSVRRSDGRFDGLYHDPNSSPYQRLTLWPCPTRYNLPTFSLR